MKMNLRGLLAIVLYILTFTQKSALCKPTDPDAQPPVNITSTCHPKPDSAAGVYIVGYGSLVSSASKTKTYPNTGPNIPVEVSGFSRKWNCMGSPVGLSTTYLGVEANLEGKFNGVVFKLENAESLTEFDKREIYYCRKQVTKENVKYLVGESSGLPFPSENSQFWIYDVIPKFIAFPSHRYPIVQSYVDIFLTGCLEMESTFNISGYADQCFNSTEGWENPWVNDRPLPRRPFVHEPKAYKIDSLIEKNIPDFFDKVFIETEILHNIGKTHIGKNSGTKTSSFDLLYLLTFIANALIMKTL